MNGVNEKDWKLFRKRLPDWQEAYMDRLNREYIRILTEEGNPSDRFWALEKRIRTDKRATGVRVENMSRSRMDMNILSLLSEGAITLDDLEGFSDELRERMARITENWK
jgi:hypothetical protein